MASRTAISRARARHGSATSWQRWRRRSRAPLPPAQENPHEGVVGRSLHPHLELRPNAGRAIPIGIRIGLLELLADDLRSALAWMAETPGLRRPLTLIRDRRAVRMLCRGWRPAAATSSGNKESRVKELIQTGEGLRATPITVKLMPFRKMVFRSRRDGRRTRCATGRG